MGESDWLREIGLLRDDLTKLERNNSESHQRLFDRLEKLERSEVARGKDFSHLVERIEGIAKDLQKICERLTSIEIKPATKWERAKDEIWKLVLVAVAAYFLGKMGLSV